MSALTQAARKADAGAGDGPRNMSQDNQAQATFWASSSGQSWVDHQEAMDAVLAPVLEAVLAQAGLKPAMDVVDIGCGTGASALAAAELVGPSGSVLGLDISPVLLARAQERASAQVQFLQADAQTHAFSPQSADAIISRFGVMFFADTTAAFANIARALRPGGMMTLAAWGAAHANPWFMVPAQVGRARLGEPPKVDRSLPGPFAFEDADRTRALIQAAGLSVEIDTAELELKGGETPNAAAELCSRIGPAASILRHFQAGEPERLAIVEDLTRVFEDRFGAKVGIPARVHLISVSR